ncbi:zinc-dependent alcohol dehydrogenase family protein [Parasphingorhabdus litoris]|uniref:Zinc-dependent alcohol dehydrogenase family protein n=1 Tax=Parasphingorhabdus litoris TaxID=394733 RepID=A0ABP3K1D1_9SPHN|nr:zinc-binding dehydrogenase [Parasphingorhabdus litoris]
MKAWTLEAPGGALTLMDREVPEALPGTVVIDMKAAPLLSYLKSYVQGEMPYWYPDRPFTPGTNGVGTVRAVGKNVYHVQPGQRVTVNPYLIAGEPVAEPAQILIGLTGMSEDSGHMLGEWADGTYAETVRMPASTVLSLEGMDAIPDSQLASLSKIVVPFGGLSRANMRVGDRVIIHGATGYFGSAAILGALALGADRVVIAGRTAKTLETLASLLGDRVIPVMMTGDVETDATALRKASGGGAHIAFDQVGNADSANGTLAALRALERNGKLVLMGSMAVPLPIPYNEMLANNWEIIGHFMYSDADYLTVIDLVRSGRIDLGVLNISEFDLVDLGAAMDAAGKMRSLDSIVLQIAGT